MTGTFRSVELGDMTASVRRGEDGVLYVASAEPLPPVPTRLTDRLDHWAEAAPERTFLAERDAAGDWRRIGYREAAALTRCIASALLERGLSAERPIAILSGNDIDQALLGFAAMRAGIPFAPISPAYSLISGDFGKLRSILTRLTPGLIFVADTEPFARAIAAACPHDVEIVATSGTLPDRTVTPFSALTSALEAPELDRITAGTGPDTLAKILFTSGSTGEPKGVINTQRMLCTNQAMLSHWFAFGRSEPPVLVDWLPWHHTFGGNHNVGYVLHHGGSLYIDGGKPTPSGIAETVRNLREIAPTVYFNVPKGYEELVRHMRGDALLRETFFSRLKLTFYAGAGLPPHVAQELDALARATTGEGVLMVTSLGATETAPAALACTRETARPGVVGLPLPGLTMKLVPNAGKLELRVKAPSVTPGYWRDPEQTAKAFDEEGFYCMGDALKFADPQDVGRGFVFDGRVSEDFKLVTGTWVSVGPLRARLLQALAPLAREAVIAGHDCDEVTAMIFPDMEACRELIGPDAAAFDDAGVLASESVRRSFAERLGAFMRRATGSSNRVKRLVLLAEPPSIDANEITDKGSINQRAVLARRAALVEALYAGAPPADVILPSEEPERALP